MLDRLADGLRLRRESGFLTLVAILPMLWAASQGIRRGWFPVGDEALTGLSAFDVFTGHPPVMGPRTTTAFESGIETHHPGPILYYLLAPTTALADGAPWGLIVGSLLICVTIIAVGIHTACRQGGAIAGLVVTLAFLGVQWALGPEAGARPFNPYPPAFAVLTFLVLTWALLDERLELVPHYVVCASFMVQSHIGYIPFLVGPVAVMASVGLIRWSRRRRTIWPLRGWRPPDHGRFRGPTRVALVLLALIWIAPTVELFRFSPNNAERVVQYVFSDRGTPLPFLDGMRFATGLTAPIPGGMQAAFDQHGAASAFIVRSLPSLPAVAVGGLLLACLLGIAIAGTARIDVFNFPSRVIPWVPTRTEGNAAWSVLIGFAAVAGTVTRLPESSAQSTWNYLQAWPVSFTLWAVLAGYLARRVVLPSLPRISTAVAVAATLIGLVAATNSPAPSRWDEGKEVAGGWPDLARALSEIDDRYEGKLHVTFDGDSLGAGYYVAPSLAFAMKDKYAVHLPAVWSSEEDTDFRKSVSSPSDTAWISVRTGDGSTTRASVNPRSEQVATVSESGIVYTLFVRGPR